MTDTTLADIPRFDAPDLEWEFVRGAADLLMAELPSVGLCSLALDGCVQIWHDTAQRLLGHSAADMSGRRFDYLAPNEYRGQGAVMRTLFDASVSGRTHIDLPLIGRDGQRRMCRVSFKPQSDRRSGFTALIQEIVQHGDGRLYDRIEPDSRSAHRANLAMIGGEPGWIGLGIEADIHHISTMAARMMAVEAEDWVGRPLDELLVSRDVDSWHMLLHRAVGAQGPQSSLASAVESRDRDKQWWVTLIALRADAQGPLIGFTLAMRAMDDVDERRTAPSGGGTLSPERAWFNAAIHDLREPLRGVREYIDRLRSVDDVDAGAAGVDYLDRIDAATRRLQENVTGVLRLARLDTAPFTPETVDLEALVDMVRQDLALLIADHQAEIEYHDLGRVTGDAIQLRLLFQNLVDNSIRYRRSDVLPRICIARVAYDAADGRVTLAYEDNSRGFPDPDQVFDRPVGAQVDGNGIGLDLCRRVVSRHRGSIAIERSDAQGTIFSIVLWCHAESDEIA